MLECILVVAIAGILVIILCVFPHLKKFVWFESNIIPTTFLNYKNKKYAISLFYNEKCNFASIRVFKTLFNGNYIRKPITMPECLNCYLEIDFKNFPIEKWNSWSDIDRKTFIRDNVLEKFSEQEKGEELFTKYNDTNDIWEM